MLVDSHVHIWKSDLPWLRNKPALRRDYLTADLTARLRQSGVERAVLVEADRGDAGETAWFLDEASVSDEIAAVVGWIQLPDPAIAEVLARYRDHPAARYLVGVRQQVQDEPGSNYLDRDEVRAGMRVVAAAGLTFDLIVRPDQLASAARLAGDHPEVTFILDHCGQPSIDGSSETFARWRAGLRKVAEHSNVAVKLSGLVTAGDWAAWTVDSMRPYSDTVLELFGMDRVMFGSDWPRCELAATYTEVLDATTTLLGGRETAAFAANAATVYGLAT